MASTVLPAPLTTLALLLAIALLAGLLWRQRARLPAATVRAIEAHFAREGKVGLIRPALMGFGQSPPGSRQYTVQVTTPGGRSRGHTIEVDAAGRVRTIAL